MRHRSAQLSSARRPKGRFGVATYLLLFSLVAWALATSTLAQSENTRPATSKGSQRTLRVHGQVLTADGVAPPGATVSLHPRPVLVERHRQFLRTGSALPRAVATTRLDEQGRFELRVPRAGFWTVRAQAPGFVPLEHPLEPLLDHRSLAPVELPVDVGLSFDPALEPLAEPKILRARSTEPRRWLRKYLLFWRPAPRQVLLAPDAPLPRWIPRAEGESLDVELLLGDGSVHAWSAVEAVTRDLPGSSSPAADSPRRTFLQESEGALLLEGVVLRQPGDWPWSLVDPRGRAWVPGSPFEATLVAADGLRRPLPLPNTERNTPGAAVVLPEAEPWTVRVVSSADGEPLLGVLHDPERRHFTDAEGLATLRLFEPTVEVQALVHSEDHLPQRVRGLGVGGDGRHRVTVRLDPGAALGGRVVDADDRPLAGVEVYIHNISNLASDRAWTDGQGRFHLGPIPSERPLRLSFRRHDLRHLELEIPALDPGERRFEPRIVLGSAPLLLGRVVDREGRPVADAEVDLAPTRLNREPKGQVGSGDDGELLTREDGRFAARVTEPGVLDLSIQATGYAPRRLPGVEVSTDSDRLDLGDVVLDLAALVQGRVVDGSGEPLAEVGVFPFEPRFDRAEQIPYYLRFRRPAARTDTQGRFTVDSLAHGSTSVLAFRRPGYALGLLRGVAAPSPEPLRVVLQPAGGIRGGIFDADGLPVPRADLRWTLDDATGSVAAEGRQATDRDGVFKLNDVPAGSLRLTANTPRHLATTLEIELEPGEVRDGVEILLGRGAVIQGRVLDATGAPLHYAALTATFAGDPGAGDPGGDAPSPDRRWAIDPRTTDSARDGSYRFEGLRPGTWVLHATRELVDQEQRVEVPADAELTVDLVLGGDGEPLEGWVVRETGEAQRGVLLRLDPIDGGRAVRAAGDDAGRFRFPAVQAGVYRVAVSGSGTPGGPPITLLEDPGVIVIDGDPETAEPPVEVRVGRGAVLYGRVLGLSSDELLQVIIGAQGERSIYDPPGARLDRLGHFRLTSLGLGPWTVTASIPGTGRRAVGQLELVSGQREAQLDLDFGSGLELWGRVQRSDETAAQGRVALVDPEGQTLRQPLDPQGRFRFTGLAAGDFTLEIHRPSGEVVRQTLSLTVSTEWNVTVDE